jgi:hypothetical protein
MYGYSVHNNISCQYKGKNTYNSILYYYYHNYKISIIALLTSRKAQKVEGGTGVVVVWYKVVCVCFCSLFEVNAREGWMVCIFSIKFQSVKFYYASGTKKRHHVPFLACWFLEII